MKLDYNSFTDCNGAIHPAAYKAEGENVILTTKTPAGKTCEIVIRPDMECYQDAVRIVKAKGSHGATPEKHFIGTEIDGPEWKIVFSSDYDRTRVIFKSYPCKAYREAVKAAGFFWSPSMKSWNKGLNFKAYRAALKLHDTLWKLREGKAPAA